MSPNALFSARLKTIAAYVGSALLLSACGSLTPTPYTSDEIKSRVVSSDHDPVAAGEFT